MRIYLSGALALLLLMVGCGKHTLTQADPDVSCPDPKTSKVPTCEELCKHTITIPGRCGYWGDEELCVATCRQVYDQPTTEGYNRLRACYFTATTCEQIAGCNIACYSPPPVPTADTIDAE